MVPGKLTVMLKIATPRRYKDPDYTIVPVANGRILASFIPDARLVTIDDGHLFLVTSDGECAAMISEFLS